MKINEILESIKPEPHEVRELFMEIAKEIIWLLDSQSVAIDLSAIDSKIDFLAQWSNSCINEYKLQGLVNNPDVAFICEVGPSVVDNLRQRRNKS